MYKTTLIGQTFPDFYLTFALSGEIADGDAILGLAVCQDTTAANTVKIATAGSEVIGQIMAYEDRTAQGEGKFVTVATKGGMKFPKSGTVAVGGYVVGAANGAVKAKASETFAGLKVWEVGSDYCVVFKD